MTRLRKILTLAFLLVATQASAFDLSSTVAYWKMNQGSGANAVDVINSITLTNTNTVGSGTGWVYTAVADFEKDNTQYFTCTSNSTVALTGGDDSFEFDVFVMLESFGDGFPMIITKDDVGANREYASYYYQAGSQFVFECNDGTTIQQALSPAIGGGAALGQVYFIRMGRDGVTDKIFIQVDNGTKVLTTSTGTKAGTASFQIAARAGANCWDGLIGPVMLTKGRVLTDNEAIQIRNSNHGWQYPFVFRKQVNIGSFGSRSARR